MPAAAARATLASRETNNLERHATYAETRAAFAWQVPPRFNIAQAVCDRHAGTNALALLTDTRQLGFHSRRAHYSKVPDSEIPRFVDTTSYGGRTLQRGLAT